MDLSGRLFIDKLDTHRLVLELVFTPPYFCRFVFLATSVFLCVKKRTRLMQLYNRIPTLSGYGSDYIINYSQNNKTLPICFVGWFLGVFVGGGVFVVVVVFVCRLSGDL